MMETTMSPVFEKFLKRFMFAIEGLLIVGTFTLINAFALRGMTQFPDVESITGLERTLLIDCFVMLLFVAILLSVKGVWAEFISSWKRNWPLVLFLAYAIFSAFWSVFLNATMYKLVFLIFSSVSASYLAIRLGLSGLISLLSWVAGFFILASLLMITLTPSGIMQNEPFVGSWVGVFWHRNHAGSLFAFFSALFLMRYLWDMGAARINKLVFLLLYILSVVLVIGCRSATGIIVFIFLNALSILISLWLLYYHRMKAWHYYLSSLILLTALLVFLLNTDYFFGLLGRSPNMTGRVPLWQDLFFNFFTSKPWFGHGYGALWMQQDFRHLMQERHGWRYEVFFADNGFFDIALNLGLVGLSMFILYYFHQTHRAISGLVHARRWQPAMPVIAISYVFIGNLTYSFLLEVDQFVWLLLVIWGFAGRDIREPVPQSETSQILDQTKN